MRAESRDLARWRDAATCEDPGARFAWPGKQGERVAPRAPGVVRERTAAELMKALRAPNARLQSNHSLRIVSRIAQGTVSMRAVLFVFVALSTASAPCNAEYKSEWQIREYIAGRTLQGVTVRDRERWRVTFDQSGSFMMQHTNGRRDRGTWSVEGPRIHLMFQRGGSSCRHIYVPIGGDVEWHNCETRVVNSIIVSPSYDHARTDSANVRKAREAENGLNLFRGIVGGMPSTPGSSIVEGIAAGWVRAGIAQILSPEGQRMNAEATLRALRSGERESWQNPGSGERGFVQSGPVQRDPRSGQQWQEVTSVIEKNGQQYQTTTNVCHTPEGPRPCNAG